jgi:hypothetical protein
MVKHLVESGHYVELVCPERIVAPPQHLRIKTHRYRLIRKLPFGALIIHNGHGIAETPTFSLEYTARPPILNAAIVAFVPDDVLQLLQQSRALFRNLLSGQLNAPHLKIETLEGALQPVNRAIREQQRVALKIH